jgi:hypothetical protein
MIVQPSGHCWYLRLQRLSRTRAVGGHRPYTVGLIAQPYPTDLTDAAWDWIKDLIPPPKPGGHHRARDIRAVGTAIFAAVDGSSKWRMLPHE